jgi:hypothetical protein
MSWRDRMSLTLGILLAVAPFAVNLFFLVRRKRYLLVTGWRYWVALTGLVLAVSASFPSPLFLFALELPWRVKGEWPPLAAAWCMPGALIAGVLAMVLLAFARGKLRWIGIASSLVSSALLYVILLGLSD